MRFEELKKRNIMFKINVYWSVENILFNNLFSNFKVVKLVILVKNFLIKFNIKIISKKVMVKEVYLVVCLF